MKPLKEKQKGVLHKPAQLFSADKKETTGLVDNSPSYFRIMKKILVANRGEIALRIMKSAREMGIATVAVYSEADRNAPFVKYADEAVCIGPPPRYQRHERGFDYPNSFRIGGRWNSSGYGFLSENANFSRKVSEAGITFIGR